MHTLLRILMMFRYQMNCLACLTVSLSPVLVAAEARKAATQLPTAATNVKCSIKRSQELRAKTFQHGFKRYVHHQLSQPLWHLWGSPAA